MSDIGFIPTPHQRQQFSIPEGKSVVGHKVVVAGLYLAKSLLRSSEGACEKRRVDYSEAFDLPASSRGVFGQGALGCLLTEGTLAARLAEHDAGFRSVLTHTIVRHENILEDLPPEE